MQTLPSGQYNIFDDVARNPNAVVTVQRNYDSIPFEGKFLQSTGTNEKTIKQVLHSDGRMSLVFSKYSTGDSKYQLYYKSSDITRNSWNAPIAVTTGSTYDWFAPAIIQLNSSTNLGIVVSRNDTELYSCTIDEDGVIQISMSDTTINGTNPSLTKINTTYWLFYERSGVIYYRTCTDFSTWSAETNFNTETGLANDHAKPYVYYDTNDKLWVTFERVTDAVSDPVVYNAYYILSLDNGSSWGSPIAITSLVAGEGSAVQTSIVDITTFRYINYTLERQVQNLDYGSHVYKSQYYDSVNGRIFYGTEDEIVIYNEASGLYDSYDSTDNASIINVTHIAYDSTNNTIIAGTIANGIIVYNEDTLIWKNYNTGTTPAIATSNIQALNVKSGKAYISCGSSLTANLQEINVTLEEVTSFEDNLVAITNFEVVQIFLESTRILVCAQCSNDYPTRFYLGYFNKEDLTTYWTQSGLGTARYKPYQVVGASKLMLNAYDSINRVLYIAAEDTNTSYDFGIALHNVTTSDATFSSYWSNEIGNPYGLLPNPLDGGYQYQYIIEMHFNVDTNRLYIFSGNSGVNSYLTVINAVTKVALEHYAKTGDTRFLANFPVIDSSLIKALVGYIGYGTGKIISNDLKVVFALLINTRSQLLIYTEAADQRIYYRKTSDDSSFSTATYLTTNSEDSYCVLAYSDSRLKAFWQRSVEGTSELKWDEDLGGELDMSEYVHNFEIDMSDETGANNASVSFADKEGLFNPLNYNSLKYDYLLENNIIKISKGNAGGNTPAFTGLIGSGTSVYTRGAQTLYNIKVYDKAKNWFKSKITSSFYENKTISFIVEDIITTYGDLSGGDYDLPTITETIPKVQFIEEYIMDILYKLYQAYGYFPYFDEEGILKAREVNIDATTDFTYFEDGTDSVAYNKAPAFNIMEYDHSWSDDTLVNQVTVIGQTEETFETEFDEEFMGFIQGAAGWFSSHNSLTFYFSEDKTLQAINPRLSVTDSCGNRFFGGGENLTTAGAGKQLHCSINQDVSNLTSFLYALIAGCLIWTILWGGGFGFISVYNGLAPVMAIALTVIGQISNFYYEILAQPIGEPAPNSITETVSDDDLIEKYGVIEEEIDNPFLETSLKCRTLANYELEKASWFRYQPKIKIVANMAHQTQDVIEAYNPVTGVIYKLYVKQIRRTYTRGEEDVDQLICALIT